LPPSVRSFEEEQRTAVERDLIFLRSKVNQHKIHHA
jgi:hypothetical protein